MRLIGAERSVNLICASLRWINLLGKILDTLKGESGTWKGLAYLAQLVEHFLGKEEIVGSIPTVGSRSMVNQQLK